MCFSDSREFEGGDVRLKQFLNRNSLPLELFHALTRDKVTFENLEMMAQYDMDAFCTKHDIPLGVKLDFKKAVEDHQMEMHEEHYQPQPGEKLKRDDKNKFDHQMRVVWLRKYLSLNISSRDIISFSSLYRNPGPHWRQRGRQNTVSSLCPFVLVSRSGVVFVVCLSVGFSVDI